MTNLGAKAKWLESYATDRHDWHETTHDEVPIFYRRIGIVEAMFNTDGEDFEGRADLTMDLHVEMRTSLGPEELKARLLLVWSVMREKHTLLSSKVVWASDLSRGECDFGPEERLYVFKQSIDPDTMLAEAKRHITFVEDDYPKVDIDEFFTHTLNSGRCINASEALSKLYVMPIKEDKDGLYQLHFIFIAAHEIVDGLTSMRWMSSFLDLVNRSATQLRHDAALICMSSPKPRLPQAQESLYPPVCGSEARQRWSWLLSRILRHTRQPPPASFQNPLRRTKPLSSAVSPVPKFSSILDYGRTPPLNTFPIRVLLSPASTKRLSRLCRQAGISIGSGCFALVAMVMMLFEERRDPGVPARERLPFVGSFPVNPRPFLTGTPTTGKEDSLMLAFSEGITLPFLSSDLNFEGRLRLLGKQAHRQLRQYQKRPRTLEDEIHLGSKSPTQLLPLLYLATMERLEGKSQESRKRGWNIQGDYPAKLGSTLATCGVSSVGARGSIISSGKYDTRHLPQGQDVVADFRNLDTTVRARDGEFLVGVVGDNDYLRFGVSYDGCAIDPDLANEWKGVLENILEPGVPFGSKL